MGDATFEHGAGFERGEVSGNLELGRLEGYYEELFAEVIEDGVITTEERARLDRMADSLGLDHTRLRRLEQALQAAYEARHRIRIREEATTAPASLAPVEPATDARTLALARKVAALSARVAELERELEEARAQVSIEVDLSDVAPARTAGTPTIDEDATELLRRVRHDPADDGILHTLFQYFGSKGELDRQWCTAHTLVYLGAANNEEAEVAAKHATEALIRPKGALTREGWARLLVHPEEEQLTGEIFAVVVPAVLMGRLSALRRDKALLKLDPGKKQDAAKTTVQAVRCFSWGAAILGMAPPQLYADPDYPGTVEMVPGVPPSTRIGAQGLSGRSSTELAFLAGRHLAMHRVDHFMRLLIPQIRDLEDIFLAALSIGNPGLPMSAQVKELVIPIAKAIEPILEPASVDRLRGHFLRFIEDGGRTNLQRWAASVDKTAARSGLLLANDLRAADALLKLEDPAHKDEKMKDLLVFVMSERYAKLRKQIGIAL
jgi:hypothetical protein